MTKQAKIRVFRWSGRKISPYISYLLRSRALGFTLKKPERTGKSKGERKIEGNWHHRTLDLGRTKTEVSFYTHP